MKVTNIVYKVVIIIMALLLIFMIFDRNNIKKMYSKLLDTEINELKNRNEILQLNYDSLELQINYYREISIKSIDTINRLKEQFNKIKNENHKIPDDVATYRDSKLDSILTNYRHIKRSEN